MFYPAIIREMYNQPVLDFECVKFVQTFSLSCLEMYDIKI